MYSALRAAAHAADGYPHAANVKSISAAMVFFIAAIKRNSAYDDACAAAGWRQDAEDYTRTRRRRPFCQHNGTGHHKK